MDQAYLEFVREGGPQTFALLGDRLTVGRLETNGLSFPADLTVSREHAILERAADGWRLRDVGSTAGCYVNGEPLTGPHTLRPGDEIGIGRTRIRFGLRAGGPPPGPARQADYLDLSEEWASAQPGRQHLVPPTPRPRRGQAQVRGEARDIQVRGREQDSDVLAFLVDRCDESGNRRTPVAVELVGYKRGQVGEGDEVEVIGKWSRGTPRAKQVANLSTHAEVHGAGRGQKIAFICIANFMPWFVAFVAFELIAASNVSNPFKSALCQAIRPALSESITSSARAACPRSGPTRGLADRCPLVGSFASRA